MSIVDLTAPLRVARDIAAETSAWLRPHAGQGNASTKSDGSFVTEFDLESDRRITKSLQHLFPSHQVMSEERGKVFEGAEWTWVIDPIDGTTNFTWGYPTWGVLIALLHNGEPVLGVADFPVLGEQYSAAKGHGAWLNGHRIHTLLDTTIHPKSFVGICSRTAERMAFPLAAKSRISGSSGYDLALVARGVYAGMYNRSCHVWDVAACWPILQEAGALGETNDPHGLFPARIGQDYGKTKLSVWAACSREVSDTVSAAFAGITHKF